MRSCFFTRQPLVSSGIMFRSTTGASSADRQRPVVADRPAGSLADRCRPSEWQQQILLTVKGGSGDDSVHLGCNTPIRAPGELRSLPQGLACAQFEFFGGCLCSGATDAHVESLTRGTPRVELFVARNHR